MCQLWQAVVSTSTANFDNFWQTASAHFKKMMCLFNFPCPFTFTYFFTLCGSRLAANEVDITRRLWTPLT